MLAVVVIEFFVCWTPLYIINSMTMFGMADLLYETITYAGISFFQLLAYSSSCCNPITYCFMNRGFRKAFLNLFRCFKRMREPRRISLGGLGGTVILGAGVGGSEGETAQLQNNQRMCTEMSYWGRGLGDLLYPRVDVIQEEENEVWWRKMCGTYLQRKNLVR